jgi:FkbM family methyltransferase
MKFNRRKTPPEFMDNQLFYQSSIRVFKIAKARFKYYKDMKNREIQIEMLLNNTKPINVLDVGALGGVGEHLIKYEKYLNFFLSEPQYNEGQIFKEKFMNKQNYTQLNFGFFNVSTNKKLFITQHPGCSSLLEPSGPGALFHSKIRKNKRRYQIVNSVSICLKRIDEVFDTSENQIHLLKLDTQGTEFEILEGMGIIRPLLIQCEVSTFEFYKNQKILKDILELLDSFGYFPIVLPSKDGHGDAIFVPKLDLIGLEIYSSNPVAYRALLHMYGLSDFASFAIDYYESYVK